MSDDLEPLDPQEGMKMYLDHREQELSDPTLSSHYYRLKKFVEWCEREGIDNLNTLTGRDLHRYRIYRRDEDGLEQVSLQGQLSTLRKYLQFCATVEAVPSGLDEKIILPSLDRDQEVSEVTLDADRAYEVLDYLDTYRYASRQHVMFLLAWHSGMRLGGLRTLDVDDYDADDRCMEVRHRPDTDTPLKNGRDGERDIALSERVCEVLDDYLQVNRTRVEDDHGRRPLLASAQGRVSRSNLRSDFYCITRPCQYRECPHDRDRDECEATTRTGASKCPSAVSAHPVRRGSITHQLNRDLPKDVVSERVNATREVLDKHYDRRTKRDKMNQRREHVDNLDAGEEGESA